MYETFKNSGYSNLKYIPNTIELQLYTDYKKNFKTPKLLWVRSFARIYNPLMAVKVFIKIRKEFPDAEICMVGPKKDDSYLKTVKFAKSEKVDIVLTGKLSKEEWIALSKDYNIFINTTHFDNTPISVIEAMALGLPVVSTNVGGIPYLLKHNTNALLVADDDVDDMAEQIKRLIVEPGLAQRLSQNGKELVKDFDWDVVKKQWSDLLI